MCVKISRREACYACLPRSSIRGVSGSAELEAELVLFLGLLLQPNLRAVPCMHASITGPRELSFVYTCILSPLSQLNLHLCLPQTNGGTAQPARPSVGFDVDVVLAPPLASRCLFGVKVEVSVQQNREHSLTCLSNLPNSIDMDTR